MARDEPIYATVSTIQLLVTSLTNNTSSIVVLSPTLSTHFFFKQFIDFIDLPVTGQCAVGIMCRRLLPRQTQLDCLCRLYE